MEGMRFEPATHELWNVAAVTTKINGAGFVPINSPLPNMKTSQELKQTDLGIVGGRMFMPADSVRIMGGVGAYMAKEKPKFLKDAGNTVEKRIITTTFWRGRLSSAMWKMREVRRQEAEIPDCIQ